MSKVIITQLVELRDKVQTGIDQLDRDEGIEWSAVRIKAKGRTLLAEKKPVL